VTARRRCRRAEVRPPTWVRTRRSSSPSATAGSTRHEVPFENGAEASDHTLNRNSTAFRHGGTTASAFVDVAPVPCCHDHDDEFVIVDLVDDAPVPCANPPSVTAGELLRCWRSRLLCEQDENGRDSLLGITRKLTNLTTCRRRDSNRIGHKPSSRRSSSSVTLSPPSAFAAS